MISPRALTFHLPHKLLFCVPAVFFAEIIECYVGPVGAAGEAALVSSTATG